MKYQTSKRYLPNRDEMGHFKARPRYVKATFVLLFILFILGGIIYSIINAPAAIADIESQSPVGKIECHFINGGFACGDPHEIVKALSEYSNICSLESVECDHEPKNKEAVVLLDVCKNYGLGEDCARTLYGMAEHESYMGRAMTGDNGKSHGYFHIMYYHNVPESCSHDLACSADWTIKRMIRYGFKENPDYAIMRHNGTAGTKTTLAYLASVKRKSVGFDTIK